MVLDYARHLLSLEEDSRDSVFALLLLPNRPRLDCRVSGLVSRRVATIENAHFRPAPVRDDIVTLRPRVTCFSRITIVLQ